MEHEPLTDSVPSDERPVWVGAPEGDLVQVLGLSNSELEWAALSLADVDHYLQHGPGSVEAEWSVTAPLAALDRVLTDGETGLRIVQNDGGGNMDVPFASTLDRDQAFGALHRLLAPHAPVENLRRPVRQFVNLAGGAAFLVAIALVLPWMVETGQMSRTQWLVATIFNTLGPTGFRLLGLALAALCLVALIVITVKNPVRTGFRARR